MSTHKYEMSTACPQTFEMWTWKYHIMYRSDIQHSKRYIYCWLPEKRIPSGDVFFHHETTKYSVIVPSVLICWQKHSVAFALTDRWNLDIQTSFLNIQKEKRKKCVYACISHAVGIYNRSPLVILKRSASLLRTKSNPHVRVHGYSVGRTLGLKTERQKKREKDCKGVTEFASVFLVIQIG